MDIIYTSHILVTMEIVTTFVFDISLEIEKYYMMQ
jgi:hypothetical protein